ncbi:phosphotransferase enzyme family-domain-containing protein [Daldinia caldariorum]|uniref:phosphotransferase enzyme family-domain-containing protein n=1 Tax=Daldinia caldariorum TaxID=326644 RepID=UPI002008C849|nr:phosphotransferase enzyme family-domain-containing protein [Daldinia caldariorum]KAI1463847.1 phosphotransferase enzyme family-domain-containing protein [Daldinia caldariorum]
MQSNTEQTLDEAPVQDAISGQSEQLRALSQDADSLFGDFVESVNNDGDANDTPSDSANIFPHQGDPAYGLQWTRDGDFLSLRPEWTVEPSVDSIISTLQKAIDPRKQYVVQHHWNGAYSRIYRVSYDGIQLILKVYLPVCPRTMTESEVATLRWVDQNTRLPVPKVHYYDSTRNNPIGFEWILMDRIDGTPLFECWRSTTQDAKERIVKQIAEYAAICFACQFNGGERASIRHYTKPFRTAFKWTKIRLRLISAELRLKLDEATEEDHRMILSGMLDLIDRLRGLRGKFFLPPGPFSDSEPSTYEDESTDEEDAETINEGDKPHEQTMLWHDDISLDNILVDENGVLQGVIGWSCVSCLPLYEACQFPAFLHQAWDRAVEPRTPYRVTRAYLENKEEILKYDVELRQHHLTLLRRVFIDEMMQRCPEWVDAFYRQRSRRDYEAAVQNCDNEFAYKIVEEWVDAVEGKSNFNKPVWSLHERFMR